MRANPQKENGYTPIANEIIEALAGIRISGEAYQCLNVVFRKTYGFNKKEDYIALSQFVLLTKMSKSSICRALLKLAKMKIIIDKKVNDNITLYRFNKDYSIWKPLTKKIIIDKKVNDHLQKSKSPLTKKRHTKDTITKDTITKDSICEQGSLHKQIIEIFDLFKTLNPIINYGHKTNRKAISDLIGQYGYEKAVDIVKYALSMQGKPYAPTITTPYQLITKLGDLKVFYQRETHNPHIVII